MTGPKELIDKLHKNQELSLEEWTELIKNRTPELSEYLFELAREERHKYYGHDVYVRGLIEFTNYCRNDCLYCGIRKSNAAAHRYRLDEDTILRCCQEGYDLGFRTFVLQGGEEQGGTKLYRRCRGSQRPQGHLRLPFKCDQDEPEHAGTHRDIHQPRRGKMQPRPSDRGVTAQERHRRVQGRTRGKSTLHLRVRRSQDQVRRRLLRMDSEA